MIVPNWDKLVPDTREKSFYPKPASFSNKLFFDVGSTLIIIQRELEKQILNEQFLQRGRVWNKVFTTLKLFDFKVLQRVRFWIEKNTRR